jgi:DNA-binding PadR family transcriptional regulator
MNDKKNPQTMLESLALELRRGAIILAVLSQLDEAEYGYSLIKKLESKGISIEQGTLYPMLRRLESQGLLESSWDVEESRPRRYYKVSQTGAEILPNLKQEWTNLTDTMAHLISEISEE